MKQASQITGLFLILVVVLKLINFSAPTATDIAIMVLFVLYAALELITLFKKPHR